MVAKCIGLMYIDVELKAHFLPYMYFSCICSNVESMYRLQ